MGIDEQEQIIKISSTISNEKPVPKIVKEIEANLARFGQHKKVLIDLLSKNRLSKNEEFDGEKWWGRLTHLAEVYFLQKARTPARKRRARLRELARILERACRLAENVRQDAIGSEMITQLFDGILPREPSVQLIPNKDGSIKVVYVAGLELKEIAPSLAAYQDGVLRAAHCLPTLPSGKSPFLPINFIRALAMVYQESTEQRAGAGSGPFTRFVTQFRAAIDPSFKSKDYVDQTVLDAVKDALRRPRRFSGHPQ